MVVLSFFSVTNYLQYRETEANTGSFHPLSPKYPWWLGMDWGWIQQLGTQPKHSMCPWEVSLLPVQVCLGRKLELGANLRHSDVELGTLPTSLNTCSRVACIERESLIDEMTFRDPEEARPLLPHLWMAWWCYLAHEGVLWVQIFKLKQNAPWAVIGICFLCCLSVGNSKEIGKDLCSNNTPVNRILICRITQSLNGILDLISFLVYT